MAKACSWSPTLKIRKEGKTVERSSRLFEDIIEVLKDRKESWKLWAFTKTPTFKEAFPNLEQDEHGEVTFPALVKALGLEESYDKIKDINGVLKQYGLSEKVFSNPEEAVQAMNQFNKKEKRFIAVATKDTEGKGLKIEVLPRDAASVQRASEQSFQNALTKEIIAFMRNLGFDVGFTSNPEYKGIFDPTNASFNDGFYTVINIAKGLEGEEALPEEFAHFIIEGFISHPLVQRLLASIDASQLQDIFGDSYEQYLKKYEGNMALMKKEAAGKMLAQYIKQKGTIKPEVVNKKRSLLSRIWNWAKGLFGKVTSEQVQQLGNNASNAIAGLYDMISSGDDIPLFSRQAVLTGDQMYFLNEKLNTPEKMAYKGMELSGRMIHSIRRKEGKGSITKDDRERFTKIKDTFEADQYADSLSAFLVDASNRISEVVKEKEKWKSTIANAYAPTRHNIQDLKAVAKYITSAQMLDDGYRDMLTTMLNLDEEENYSMFVGSSGNMEMAKVVGESLAKKAHELLNILDKLVSDKHDTERRVLYMYSRTVFTDDIMKGGKLKDDILSLHVMLEHADKDISFLERWISPLSDASDSLLPVIDSLVKAQQYERDMEMIEWKKQIFAADKKLREAGLTSDIMYEKNDKNVPTGRIRSQYDFSAWTGACKKERERLEKLYPDSPKRANDEFQKWRREKEVDPKTGHTISRLIKVYIDPEFQALYEAGKETKIPQYAIFEEVPNPRLYSEKKDAFEKDFPEGSPQREYYDKMIEIKQQMMMKIPHRGQHLYKAVYVSKDLVEGIMDNSTGNPMKATFDYYVRHFTRRPDDIGFGSTEEYKADVLQIIKDEPDADKAAEKIIRHLSDTVDDNIHTVIRPRSLSKIINDKSLNNEEKVKKIISTIATGSFYEVDTDFANHKIHRLPIYYTRPLRRDKDGAMPMLSTDFTGTMVAYSAMAVNYEKMNEVVDILEVARDYVKDREILEDKNGEQTPYSMFQAFGRVFEGFVTKAGNGSSISGRLEDYLDSVVYEQHKKDEGTIDLLGLHLDTAKTLDALKDYTGLLLLGLNAFSTISNLTVGKVQQWIEAVGGEDFDVKDYALGIKQYSANIVQCMAEMANPIKHNKLSLLIEMFDPMKDYYDSLKDTHNGNSIVSRLLGNGVLGYIGMNAGEHVLRVQTMLACLNHIKLVDINNPNGEKISLYDALEVVTDADGISRLEMKPNLAYERDMIDNSGSVYFDASGKFKTSNKNYGKPLKDENGKIKTELVQISFPKTLKDPEERKRITRNYNRFIQRKRKRMGKVNDSLNGAFSTIDKGAAHRRALLRLAIQFRQWMPAHYSRRFAPGHYDGDMEQWREGYYVTVGRIMNQVAKDIIKSRFEYEKIKNSLSEHEKANFRRAEAEVSLFLMLFSLIRIGGRVKDRDRSWADKMVLYQLHRMYLEVGASFPLNPSFFANIIQLLNSPAAALSTVDRIKKVFNVLNMFDEIDSGRYQGWSEWERDLFEMLPYAPQIWKAYDFDESMFSMFEKDN